MTALLLGAGAIDELLSGIPALGAPDIQVEFGLTYGAVAAIVLVAPQLVGLLLEPPLFLLADRYPRKRFVVGGLLLMGAGAITAGCARTPTELALALIAWYLGSGCGVGLSQAVLFDAEPERGERWMTRWTLAACIGDLAAPLGFALLAALAMGWRTAFVIVGALTLIHAASMACHRFPSRKSSTSAEPGPGVRQGWRAAARHRRLWLWLFGCWLCGLLDETLVVFGSLYLRDELGLGPAAQAGIVAAFTAGSLLGLAICDRLLVHFDPLLVLRRSAGACAMAYVVWLASDGFVMNAVLLFIVGALAAPLYPIARAQAYRSLPGRSGTVNALDALFTPASLLLPLALGWLAETVGLLAALAVLVAQPVGLWWIARRVGAGAGGPRHPEP